MRVILIIVYPGRILPATETATYNRLHAAVIGKFEEWWHHIPNTFMVKTELTPDEVYQWLNRVWPQLRESGQITAFVASFSSSALVLDVTAAAHSGRLPSWSWVGAALQPKPASGEAS